VRRLRSLLPGIVALGGLDLGLWGYLQIKPMLPGWIRLAVFLSVPAALYGLYRGWVIRAPGTKVYPGYRPDILTDPARRYFHSGSGRQRLYVLGSEGCRRLAVLIAGISLMFAQAALSNALKHGGPARIVLIFPLIGLLFAWSWWPDEDFSPTDERGIQMAVVQTPRKFNLSALLFVLAIGLAFVAFGGYQMWLDLETASWPKTEAVIEKSEVVHSIHHSTHSGSSTMYRPEIVFRYRVGGQSYTSDRIYRHAAGSVSVWSWARETVRQYPVGRRVQVAYNPDDPAEVVLKPGQFGLMWIPTLIGAAVIGLALILWRRPPRNEPGTGNERLLRVTHPGAGQTATPRNRDQNAGILNLAMTIRRVASLVFFLVFVGVFARIWFQSQHPQAAKPQQARKQATAATQPATPQPAATSRSTPVSLPTGKQVVVQKIQPETATPVPAKIPEPVRRFLARIEQEPSPCPGLVDSVDQRIAQGADLNDLFTRLQRCKWQRPTYAQEKADGILFRHSWPDPWPEEPAIRKVITAMAGKNQPPAGVQVLTVPHADPPVVDGVLHDDEWNGALVFSPKHSGSRVYLETDGDFLYLGIAVPQGSETSNYDSARVLLHAHLSPHFTNEYFFVYSQGYSSQGTRSHRLRPEGDAKIIQDFHQLEKLPKAIRWKHFKIIYDGGVFPRPPSGTFVQGGLRMYEAAIDLKKTGIPKRAPFSLGLQVDTTVNVNGRKNRKPVWPFKWDYTNDGPEWEVWLRIEPK